MKTSVLGRSRLWILAYTWKWGTLPASVNASFHFANKDEATNTSKMKVNYMERSSKSRDLRLPDDPQWARNRSWVFTILTIVACYLQIITPLNIFADPVDNYISKIKAGHPCSYQEIGDYSDVFPASFQFATEPQEHGRIEQTSGNTATWWVSMRKNSVLAYYNFLVYPIIHLKLASLETLVLGRWRLEILADTGNWRSFRVSDCASFQLVNGSEVTNMSEKKLK